MSYVEATEMVRPAFEAAAGRLRERKFFPPPFRYECAPREPFLAGVRLDEFRRVEMVINSATCAKVFGRIVDRKATEHGLTVEQAAKTCKEFLADVSEVLILHELMHAMGVMTTREARKANPLLANIVADVLCNYCVESALGYLSSGNNVSSAFDAIYLGNPLPLMVAFPGRTNSAAETQERAQLEQACKADPKLSNAVKQLLKKYDKVTRGIDNSVCEMGATRTGINAFTDEFWGDIRELFRMYDELKPKDPKSQQGQGQSGQGQSGQGQSGQGQSGQGKGQKSKSKESGAGGSGKSKTGSDQGQTPNGQSQPDESADAQSESEDLDTGAGQDESEGAGQDESEGAGQDELATGRHPSEDQSLQDARDIRDQVKRGVASGVAESMRNCHSGYGLEGAARTMVEVLDIKREVLSDCAAAIEELRRDVFIRANKVVNGLAAMRSTEDHVTFYGYNPSFRGVIDMATGVSAIMSRYHNKPRNDESMRVGVYVDISGSMSPHLPTLAAVIRGLRQLIADCDVYTFDTEVKVADLAELASGLCQIGGGTEFNAVFKHFMQEGRHNELLIITDGDSYLQEVVIREFKSRGKKLYVIYAGTTEQSIVTNVLSPVANWEQKLLSRKK